MKPEIIRAGFKRKNGQNNEICAVFRSNGQTQSVYFRSDGAALAERPEALAAAGILPAMCSGSSLHLDGSLDPVFSDNLEQVQNLFSGWDNAFRRVRVVCDGVRVAPAFSSGERVGLFFSGGVDSFYSLLTHQNEITDLIFVQGFDIRPDDREHARLTEENIRKTGEQFGKRVIVVETDLRLMLNRYTAWGERAHGAAMAAVAHLLTGEFRRMYFAASDSFPSLSPWGSHPHLDPLWSTSGLEFFHDGYEFDRLEKIRRIASCDVALQNLRVCWKNRKGALNCGRCEKCIRTMIGLRIAGALDRCPVFEKPLSIWRVLRIMIPHPRIATGQIKNLAALKEMPENRWLYRALSFAFFRSHLKTFLRKIVHFRL